MCGVCNVWCVYVWVLPCVGVCVCVGGLCNVWVCVFVGFVMCGVCMYGFCKVWCVYVCGL